MPKLVTLEEVNAALERTGTTASQIAAELGVDAYVVRGVLSGRLQGRWGDAHRVAVLLGLKEGEVIQQGQSVVSLIRAQAAA